MRTCLPLKGYVHYFQVNHALRNFNFCDVTYFLAKQTLCNRSIDGNLSFLQIGFTFGNDSINHLHAILHVLKLYLIENLYRIGFNFDSSIILASAMVSFKLLIFISSIP